MIFARARADAFVLRAAVWRFPARSLWPVLPCAAYFALGSALSLSEHHLMTDAWSRVGSASYVLLGRDPHLAAIGFVWGPLQPLLMLPLVLLKPLFPGLVHDGLAAVVLSAVAMGLAVGQMHGLLGDIGVRRGARAVLTTVFAAHPIVVLYAANGMTEALFLLLLMIAVRQTVRFLSSNAEGPLAAAALALAAAYLVRYEALAAGAGLLAVVVGRAWSVPRLRPRRTTAIADGVTVAFPLAVSFVTWAAASWLIVGSPFEQFTSVYGTASQIAVAGDALRLATGQGTTVALAYLAEELVGLAPFGAAALVLLALSARVRTDRASIVTVFVFGGVLLFAAAAFLAGRTIGSLRYFIEIVPLTIVVAGVAIKTAAPVGQHTAGSRRTIPILLAVALSIPFAFLVMADPRVGREEWYPTQLFLGMRPEASLEVRQYRIGREIASYVDSLDLPDGSVVVDVFTGFSIVLQSEHPSRFVITPDRDFVPIATDPEAFKVRYVLVPPVGGLGALDALERRHPGIYAVGPPDGTLVRDFSDSSGPSWRLYATAVGSR